MAYEIRLSEKASPMKPCPRVVRSVRGPRSSAVTVSISSVILPGSPNLARDVPETSAAILGAELVPRPGRDKAYLAYRLLI